MSGIGVFSLIGQVLSERNWLVADLEKRLRERGHKFNRKTIYRLTYPIPIKRVDAIILRAVSEELQLPLERLITFDIPKLQKLDPIADKRLSLLMAKNDRGDLTEEEKQELQELGEIAEKLSLQNARIFAAYRKINPDSSVNQLPRQEVAVRFRKHKDQNNKPRNRANRPIDSRKKRVQVSS
jgi:hypothetical protein